MRTWMPHSPFPRQTNCCNIEMFMVGAGGQSRSPSTPPLSSSSASLSSIAWFLSSLGLPWFPNPHANQRPLPHRPAHNDKWPPINWSNFYPFLMIARALLLRTTRPRNKQCAQALVCVRICACPSGGFMIELAGWCVWRPRLVCVLFHDDNADGGQEKHHTRHVCLTIRATCVKFMRLRVERDLRE